MAVKQLSEVQAYARSALPPNAVPFPITTRTLQRTLGIPAVECTHYAALRKKMVTTLGCVCGYLTISRQI